MLNLFIILVIFALFNKNIFWVLLAFVIYNILFKESVEMFRFEVTPWKTTCGSLNRCPGCCSRGYKGQPASFEYTGDGNHCCGNVTQGPKNIADDYYKLDKVWTNEGYEPEKKCCGQ
jgi:hypothetical protein